MSEKGWIPVVLSPDDRKLVEQVGEARRGSKQAVGLRSSVELGLGQELNGQVMGFAAEMALAKLLGISPNTAISIQGNAGVHLQYTHVTNQGRYDPDTMMVVGRTENILTFNAAWASSPVYDLRYFPDKVPPVDIMVQVTGRFPVLWITGCISHARFMEKAAPRNYGHGFRLALPQGSVSPIHALVSHLGLDRRQQQLLNEYRRFSEKDIRARGFLFGDDTLRPTGGSFAES